MNPTVKICFLLVCLACSANKKITVSMTEILTNKWKGKDEEVVLSQIGHGYTKEVSEKKEGYSFLYNLSSVDPKNINNKKTIVVDQRTDYSKLGTSTSNNQIRTSQVVGAGSQDKRMQYTKYIEFYFDKNKKVTDVFAFGFPDSVYYVKRK